MPRTVPFISSLIYSSGRTLRSPIYGSSDQKCIPNTLTISTKRAGSFTNDGEMHRYTVSQQLSFYQNHRSISSMILAIVILPIFAVLRTKNRI